jgi:hypothetical protein
MIDDKNERDDAEDVVDDEALSGDLEVKDAEDADSVSGGAAPSPIKTDWK